MISKKMEGMVANSSAIRAMFEEGNRLAKIYGPENVFDFSLGNPNVPAPEAVKTAIRELLDEEDSLVLHGYTNSNAGYEDVRQAVAESLNERFGTAFSAKNITMTVGAAGGLNVILKTLINPGDEVITFAPYFPEYKPYIEGAGVTLKIIPADTESFQINFDLLEQEISEKTAAVLINTPNNPSGVVYSTETVKRLAALLTQKSEELGHTIYLISDEPYREIVFAGVDNPFVSDYYADTIICYSFSKSLSLPGERIGYVAVNPACSMAELIIDMCAQISRCIGHNCPSSLIQYVAGRMCGETSDLTVYETNARMLYKELTAMGYTCQEPGGTFYMFPKALEEDAMAFCQKALEYNLVLVPGDSFGCPGYFRISYCVQTEKAERSVEAFKKLAKAYGL